MRIDVILPVLNEEKRIAERLTELQEIPDLHELIVVDGGSTDRTVDLARTFAGVRVLSAPTGRARQMNAGALVASGDVLLFLHADVSLPQDAPRWIRDVFTDQEAIAGAFRTWTICDDGRSWVAPLLHLADMRSRITGHPYGDQALFVRSAVFHQLGGYPEIPLLEDLALSRRLRLFGRVRTVPATVRVSGRRFIARPIYYTLLMYLIPLLYRLGVPPPSLSRLYGNPR